MSRSRHISQSVQGALNLSYKQFAMLFRGVFSDDDGRILSTKEARKYLKQELKMGHQLIASVGCDNFDPKKGCLGHEEVKE